MKTKIFAPTKLPEVREKRENFYGIMHTIHPNTPLIVTDPRGELRDIEVIAKAHDYDVKKLSQEDADGHQTT